MCVKKTSKNITTELYKTIRQLPYRDFHMCTNEAYLPQQNRSKTLKLLV